MYKKGLPTHRWFQRFAERVAEQQNAEFEISLKATHLGDEK
jgi:hypothetical protein